MVMPVDLETLKKWLRRTPVLVDMHPLIPICFDQEVQVVTEPAQVFRALDDRERPLSSHIPILITGNHPNLLSRFPSLKIVGPPSAQIVNQYFHHQVRYVQENLLTTAKVAARVDYEIGQNNYDAVILLLVDGLSYEDVRTWKFPIEPCFVDGPSVTYRFYDSGNNRLIPSVGFASIISSPSIFERVTAHGYMHAQGYTYWEPDDNIIADYMFRGIPTRRVTNFQHILTDLSKTRTQGKTYIQIVREGLDGLAHGKRELRSSEVVAALGAIKDDVDQLCTVLKSTYQSACVYVTADHGILWKNDHPWQSIYADGSKARFTSRTIQDQSAMGSTYDYGEVAFSLYRYPVLGAKIPANDSGVHGGLSYQESFVPFIKIEV